MAAAGGFIPNERSSYSPQPPGPLRLVDVDEVGHHAALEQTALSLHPDLEQHTHTPPCEVHRFDLSHLFIPQKDETHLEDVGGVGQAGGHDSRHHATEDVDDHGLICGAQPQVSAVSHQQSRFGIITSSAFMSAL